VERERALGRISALLADWPELGARNARGRARLAAAMGQLTCTVRMQFGEGLMEHIGSKGESGPQGQGPLCQRAAATHERCASLLRSGLGDVQEAWLWTSREVDEL
jgi:hypothetical protein